MKKIKVGIDINEIFRARWIQFDRFYAQEFGEDNIPEQQYVFDYFNDYVWNDTKEEVKELKEPDEMPDSINPLDYAVDDNGDAPADVFLFKKSKSINLTAKEVYNRFMYEDFLFEIFGSAPLMYKNLDVDVNKFYFKYKDHIEFVIFSVENEFSISPTLFFLSKMSCKFTNIKFVKKNTDIWKDVDVLITTDPDLLTSKKPQRKKLIKIIRPYNKTIRNNNINIEKIQLNELRDDKKFEKIIRFKNKK